MAIERRLAAILAGDVAGFSRLVEAEEEATLSRLRVQLREVIEPGVTAHRGRVFKTTGDGFLAEFASVVDAARCAVSLQQALSAHEDGIGAARRIAWRLGLNLGDVVVEDGDVHGDGVNVAARLEALAEPGTVCVSATAYEHLQGKLELGFEDLGEQALKNIARPVRAYRLGARSAAAVPAPRPALPLPDKPSLVVLPFQNMSGDAEQEYFADGMTEEITTALSRIRQFFVIARNTAFTYKGRKLDLRQVGRELGVRYLLEGSVRKAGNRVRITGQLIEAETGTHLWADKFDGALEDVFDLQDRVTSSVVGAIEPSITKAEIERAKRKPPEKLAAYDLVLRSLDAQWPWTRDSISAALRFARKAVELEPDYALALALVSNWIAFRSILDTMDDEAGERREAISYAHRAVQLDADDPRVLAYAGYGLRVNADDVATALQWFDRAIALNPNSAAVWSVSAIIRNHAGDYAIAAEHALRAMRLSPYDPMASVFDLALGMSHLMRRNVEEAIRSFERSTRGNSQNTTSLYLASALAHAGRLDEARTMMADALRIRPKMTVARERRRALYKIREDYEFLLEGARLAGLPE